MKKIIFIFLLLISKTIYAFEVKTILCEQNSALLSELFSRNWEKTPTYYFSYLKYYLQDNFFEGTLHTTTDKLPADKNPQLSFYQIQTHHVSHYGVWLIDCLYKIGNSSMLDLADGYLHMVTTVNDYEYKCKKINKISVMCGNFKI